MGYSKSIVRFMKTCRFVVIYYYSCDSRAGNFMASVECFINWLFLFRPLKMGRNFVFRYVLVFCFHEKTGTKIYHRTGLSDVSCKRPYSRDSNHIKNYFSVLRKTGLKILFFRLFLSE